MLTLTGLYPNPHPPGCFWHYYAETYGSPNIKWCEKTLCQFISEPANTWSNLLYLIIAVYLFIYKKPQSFELKLFAPVVFIMGFFSLVYHLSNFYVTQIFDFMGMFIFINWCVGMNLIRMGALKKEKLLSFMAAVTIMLVLVVHYMYLQHLKYQSLILIGAVAIGITEFLSQKKRRTPLKSFGLGMLVLAIAFGFSLIDHSGRFCDPSALMHGHAGWHMTSAIAMLFSYEHFNKAYS
jgi:hypothetical protein